MTAAYQQIEQQEAAFSQARAKYSALERHMGSEGSMRMTHAELEAYVVEKTREIARDMVQGHMDLRGGAERRVQVVGSDGVERSEPRPTTRKLRLLVGNVVVPRLLYQAAGVEGLAPQDGALSLARDSFSMGVRRRVAEEALRGSFEQVVERISATTGAQVAKRQAEQLVLASAVDFEEFYLSQEWQPENTKQLLNLTFDGAGIIMRLESLREQTRNKAHEDAAQPEAWPQRLKAGEKANRKRMAEVAAVYSIEPYVRTADDIIGDMASIRLAAQGETPRRPRPINKRVWASVERDMADVIDDGFREALRRDPQQERTWVVLVDGQTQQLDAICAAAKRHGVTITIICDFIHVMEYLWKAAHCFHDPGTNEARAWVTERARMLLEGADPSQVAAGMRRSATRQGLTQRKAIDVCARYLKKRRATMLYGEALAAGYPIASGVIEGACRHLVRDRLDCCGARWGVNGAESVLKLRALSASGDFDDYWAFHLRCEHQRNHVALYANATIPNPIPTPRLRRIK
jgi:hypothetical protein